MDRLEREQRWTTQMRAALDGDQRAYADLLESLSKHLRAAVRSACARWAITPADVEDIVQETLLAVHLKRHTWDRTRSIGPWLNATWAVSSVPGACVGDKTAEVASNGPPLLPRCISQNRGVGASYARAPIQRERATDHTLRICANVFSPLMCERYVIPTQSEVEQEFRPAQPWWKFSRSFNVAAERNVPVLRLHQGETEGVMLRWGLIPDWAEADLGKGWTAHAPADEMTQSDSLAGAWSRGQRCILPMAGYYGWQLTPARYRQPFFIRLINRAVFGIAALWDRTVSEQDDVIESCALLTVPSNPLIANVNNVSAYMPAILRREDYAAWLGGSPAEASSALRTCPPEQMAAHPISPRINSLKFDDALLVRAIEVAEDQRLAVG